VAFCLWPNYFKDTSKMRKAGACCVQEYRLTTEKQICSLSPVNTRWPEVSMRFDYLYFLAMTLEHAALRHFVSTCPAGRCTSQKSSPLKIDPTPCPHPIVGSSNIHHHVSRPYENCDMMTV